MLMNMKDILKVAKENRFAIPAFNISDWSMFIGIMDLCEETNSPVIIEIHPDELHFTGPDFVAGVRERALKSPVPVCIHLSGTPDAAARQELSQWITEELGISKENQLWTEANSARN